MATARPNPKLDDRRTSELWLQEALQLSLYDQFCAKEQALILHGKRHGSLPDFALLDKNRQLILVELKRGRLTMSAAQEARSQLKKYVKIYRELSLREHATWYCRHLVDVTAWFEYRGPDYYQPIGQRHYGWLNRWSPHTLEHYRAGEDPTQALEILRADYKRIVVGNTLDGLSDDDRLDVSRCILIAESWPPDFPPDPIDGVSFELWHNLPPAQWIVPSPAQP